jgi:hypothetical protein
MSQDYKYDVAFSFLVQDETLATQINDLIQDRAATFLYSKRQEEIAGTDGELTFNKVFGEQSRTVFVLYRKGWGETPWTRIEETAIRNRAHEDGYDFALFAPLDKPPEVPRYLPKNRIWVGLERWGIPGAASVVEARIQELGGQAKQETIEAKAVRVAKEIEFKEQKRVLFSSEKGVQLANEEAERLFEKIKSYYDSILRTTESVAHPVPRTQGCCSRGLL